MFSGGNKRGYSFMTFTLIARVCTAKFGNIVRSCFSICPVASGFNVKPENHFDPNYNFV